MSRSPIMLSGEIADRYLIEDELGRGGTAVVYRARDRVRGGQVAIKVLREEALGSLSVERFLREIRLTANLPHPHIVPVLDSGEHEGRPYFVLPYMEGGTFRRRLTREKQLAFAEVLSLGVTMCKALDFAHKHGLIHRDVKPENILFSSDTPCLADFGTARALEKAANDPTTSTDVIRGTPAYMSPEQASGEREYDGRSDIYSLGLVLYEAIAGMPPFIGPTAQAIISQRLSHAPRPISIYRPTVPPELEEVLAKATAIVPAERYATAREFGDALESVVPALSRRPSASATSIGAGARRPAWLWGAVIVAAILASLSLLLQGSRIRLPWFSPSLTGDTTLVAILPIEATTETRPFASEDLFAEGLRRWTGVSAVETFASRDAVKRRGKGALPEVAMAGLTLEDDAVIAAGLGAGRFIKARIINMPGLHALYGALYDVASGKELHHDQLELPPEPTRWPAVFAELTDQLMLRGRKDDPARKSKEVPLNLPAYQIFLEGRSALGDWNLAKADSLFSLAVRLDSANARAFLWIAQVRSWRGLLQGSWVSAALRARDHSSLLTKSERPQAAALAALGGGQLPAACEAYRLMTAASPRDYIGWYGLGDCLRLDRTVIPDATSPSGFRYRASYEQAIVAYRRAFELLPSAYSSVQSGAFEPLRLKLYTLNILRRGGLSAAEPNSHYARVTLDHDTVVFIPYLRDTVLAGPPRTDPTIVARALVRNRKIFQDLVAKWHTSLPDATGTREAVAVSLEMLGDPAAADSFRSIRSDVQDPSIRLRLALQEVIVRLKVAISERPDELRASRVLADSILAATTPGSPRDAELLSRVSTLTGRCQDAARLARMAATQSTSIPLAPSILTDGHTAFASWAAGCETTTTFPRVAELLRRSGISEKDANRAEYEFLGSAVAMRFPMSPETIRRLGGTSGDYILRAETYLLDGDTANAKRLIGRYRDARLQAPPGDLSTDAGLIEARLWLAMGDTVTARRLLDKLLGELRYVQPLPGDGLLPNMLRLGAIAPAMELRALLATDDPAVRRRWANATMQLWVNGDPEVRSRVARLRALAR